MPVIGFVTVTVLGALRAGDAPMWIDEAFSGFAVDQSFPQLARLLSQASGMHPWYVVLWGWAQVSTADAWLRMFAVLGGALTVALTIALAQRWFGRGAAVATGALLTLHPMFLQYLTELRAYSWLMALAVLATLLLAHHVDGGGRGNAVAYGCVVGLAFAIHPVAAFLAIAHLAALWWLPDRVALYRGLVPAAVAAAVSAAPSAVVLLRNAGDPVDWIDPLSARQVIDTARPFFGGLTGALVLLGGAAAFLVTRLRRRSVLDSGADRLATLAPPLLVAVPAALMVGQAVFVPSLLARYLTPILPFLVLMAGAGFAALVPRRAALPALLVATALVAKSPLLDDVSRDGRDAHALADHLQATLADDELLVVQGRFYAAGLAWYAPGLATHMPGYDPAPVDPWERFRPPPELVRAAVDGACDVRVVTASRDAAELLDDLADTWLAAEGPDATERRDGYTVGTFRRDASACE